MPIDETKPASSLLIDVDQVSLAEIQNRFGSRHEVISDVKRGKHITILVVETNDVVSGNDYATLEDTLKKHFGVTALQTVFDVTVPSAGVLPTYSFDIHISGHLRARSSGND
jgi:hypothetical protein